MLEMYNGAVNSPETTITNNISNTDTLIYVLDETKIPSDLPNIMVLGTGAGAETIKVLSINEQALTVERAFQGTAKAWNAGTIITRNFTEYDYKALKENVEELEVKDENQNKEIEEIKTKDIEQDEKISQLSNPNLLINGGFLIWQDGEIFDIPANAWGYTADMFMFVSEWGAVVRVSRLEQKYFRIHILTAGGTSNLTYYFEDIQMKQLLDKEVTISIKLRADVSFQFCSTGFQRISIDNQKTHNVTGDMEFKVYTHTFKFQKAGEEGSNLFQVFRMLTGGIVGFIDIEYIKLEMGNIATPHTQNPISQELLLCQRYYEIKTNQALIIGAKNSPEYYYCSISGFQTKRIAPSIFFINDANACFIKIIDKSKLSTNAHVATLSSMQCIIEKNAAELVGGDILSISYVANARIY